MSLPCVLWSNDHHWYIEHLGYDHNSHFCPICFICSQLADEIPHINVPYLHVGKNEFLKDKISYYTTY